MRLDLEPARDFVRLVREARKAAGLRISDGIRLTCDTPAGSKAAAIERFALFMADPPEGRSALGSAAVRIGIRQPSQTRKLWPTVLRERCRDLCVLAQV